MIVCWFVGRILPLPFVLAVRALTTGKESSRTRTHTHTSLLVIACSKFVLLKSSSTVNCCCCRCRLLSLVFWFLSRFLRLANSLVSSISPRGRENKQTENENVIFVSMKKENTYSSKIGTDTECIFTLFLLKIVYFIQLKMSTLRCMSVLLFV